MRTRVEESWRKGSGCPDVEVVGDIARDTVGAEAAAVELDADLDRVRKTKRKTRRKGK